MKRILTLCIVLGAWCTLMASERTLLLGPKTIGRGWRDNIVVQPEQFKDCRAGDFLVLYTSKVHGGAQGALQDPATWQAIAPSSAYFDVQHPVQIALTDSMIAILKDRGVAIAGHDYTIERLAYSAKEDYEETPLFRGPKMRFGADWSGQLPLDKSMFRHLQVGDGLRFYVQDATEDAAFKLMNFRYDPLNSSVDGARIGGDFFTYTLYEQSQLVQLQIANDEGVVARVGGKSYTLVKITRVRYTGERDTLHLTAQKAPKEYVLRPGELFHGEKVFPCDWSGNITFTAEAFQNCNTDAYLMVMYRNLLPDCKPQISFRETKHWNDLSGADEVQYYPLDGQVVTYHFNSSALNNVKMRGFVLNGIGATITRIVLVKP